jgi:hypothetical protein
VPAITPSYLYTFIAMIAVSTLLVASFMAYANALRASSETTQLENLMDNIAAKSTELLTLTLATNASAETFIQMPTAIGEKQYWLQLHNDSERAWLEGGFGSIPVEATETRVYLPKEATANGFYIAGYGAAHLKCENHAGFLQITLVSSNVGG